MKDFESLKREWDATLTIADLAEELEDGSKELTPEELAIRELERGFPFAVSSLVSLALHAQDDRVRRQAANDVINHNLAYMAAKTSNGDRGDKLMNFMKDVTVQEVEKAKAQVAATKPDEADLPLEELKRMWDEGEPVDIVDRPPVGENPVGHGRED